MAPTLLAAFLIVLLQAGFGLVATGLVRAKNAAHTMAMHVLVLPAVAIGLLAAGFALLGDTPASHPLPHWTFHHSRGYFLSADKNDPAALAWFLLAAGYAGVAAAIPTGALAERWRLKSFLAMALLVGLVIWPVVGCWVWTGGWLAQLGTRAGLGHGAVDYAGSAAVHVVGGSLALVGVWLVRPRLGKYDENRRPRPILGHNVPMVMLGTLVLAFGWFGFTTGRSFVLADGRAGLIAVNTLLAGSTGALAAAGYMGFLYGKPDPSLTCNGLLAGLVSICAGCAFVAPWAAVAIGAIGGMVAVWGVLFCERRGLDDPVGATSTHGLAGAWGMLAVGLFADGSFGAGYNAVAGPVRGVFYGGGGGPLLAQVIALGAAFAWAALIGFAAFAMIARLLDGHRVPPDVELAGLDIPEMGAPGYPEFVPHLAPDSYGGSLGAPGRLP